MSPIVRVFNPPRPKVWTYEQAADRKEKAERAARYLQGDDDRADQLAAMSPEGYAAERGIEINPRGGGMRKKVSEEEARGNPVAALQTAFEKQELLHQRIHKLQLENKQLEEKLGEIEEIVTCDDPDCEAEDHLAEIEELVVEKKGHGEED